MATDGALGCSRSAARSAPISIFAPRSIIGWAGTFICSIRGCYNQTELSAVITPFFFAQRTSFVVGTWLSLVEHSLGVRGGGSSNLPVPTIFYLLGFHALLSLFPILWLRPSVRSIVT